MKKCIEPNSCDRKKGEVDGGEPVRHRQTAWGEVAPWEQLWGVVGPRLPPWHTLPPGLVLREQGLAEGVEQCCCPFRFGVCGQNAA